MPLTPLLIFVLMVGIVLGGSPRVGASAGDSGSATPTATPTATPGSLPAASSVERRMFEALNAERIGQGLTPVAWSYELATAAALHSADMAINDYLDHDGADGSSPQQRAARQGYVVPPGTGWLVIEAISARPSLEAALDWLLSDGLHRRVLLRPVWREVGIGYVAGGRYGNYWTLDFGCRPNVLPVFANPAADGQNLSLTFTNEQCATYGGGPDQMGRATEVMLSPYRDFHDGVWEPFADARQFARPDGRDLNVRLRDASGRLSAPVRLTLDGANPSPSVSAAGASVPGTAPTVPPTPSPTDTPTPSPTATSAPTATPTATPSHSPTPTDTPTPVPTDEPIEE